MDVEIGELSSDVTALDLTQLKADVVAEVLRRVEEERRLRDRLDRDRQVREGALDRAPGVS
jgi:hypothetical protein